MLTYIGFLHGDPFWYLTWDAVLLAGALAVVSPTLGALASWM